MLFEENKTILETELLKKKRYLNIFHNPITAWIILIISLVLTVGAYFLSASFVQKRVEDRFSFRTIEIESAIKDRLGIYEQALWGGVGLMNSSQSVSRQEWAKYVETLKINQHWPGIQGIGFSIPVQPAEKQAHIRNIRSEGFPEYLIKPEGTRDLYSAIIYLEPFDWRNQRAFGYDMWSNKMRRRAMTYARDEGVAATSGIITLVQETKEDIQRGFLMYLPVYQTKTIPKTLQEKREQFEGWVYAPFRAGDLMRGIAGTEDLNIEFEIFDGETMSQEALLFDSNSELHLNRSQPNQGLQKTVSITLQGRLWTLYFSTHEPFLENSEMNQPRFVGLAGGFVDLLLFYVIYSLYFINRRAENIAKEMTQESRNANDELLLINTNLKKTTVSRDYMDSILQSMTDTLIVIGSDATIQTVNLATLYLLGYEESELVEKPIKWVITEEEQKLDLFSGTGLEKLIKKGSVQGIEMTYTAKKGQQIPMLFSSSVMEDKEGTFKGIVCVAQDITERKQAEDALRESEERWRSLTEDSPDLIFTLDSDLKIQFANNPFHGFTVEELIGTFFYQYIKENEKQDEVKAILKSVQRTGEQQSYETVYHTPEGEIIHYESQVVSRMQEGSKDATGLTVCTRNISQHKHLEKELQTKWVQLRQLAARLAEAEESERKRLSQELHDRVGQTLTILGINLSILKSQLPPEAKTELGGRLEDSQKMVEETIEVTRDIMAELRPGILDDFGLPDALRWFGEVFAKRTGIRVEIQSENLSRNDLSPAIETSLFRINQEAMTNVAKHGEATHILIFLEKMGDKIIYTIKDNGKGFDPESLSSPGWGLVAMRERSSSTGGQLHIESGPGKGTEIRIEY
jgi:PAS domain S-box-containing protein